MRMRSGSSALARQGESLPAVWSPWDVMTEMHRRMDEIFGRPFGVPGAMRWAAVSDRVEPAVDVYETDSSIVALLALPGYASESIRVETTTDTLSIQGERGALFSEEKATAHRASGLGGASQFSVSYTLPAEIDPDQVKASLTNGVLQVEMQKAQHARPKGVTVTVGGK